jgi:ABC-type transport system involved in multi-copper enzyme maturation permease subunit
VTEKLAGIRAVAGHELRVRLRTGRVRLLLAVWVLGLSALTAVLWQTVHDVDGLHQRGVPVFGGLMMMLLALSLLIVPTLAAQSINGDRERGVLAVLQVTLLTPAEIALGKLLAAWGTALVFLALAVPIAASTLFMGGVGAGRLIVTVLVVAVLMGVVCAIAQCWSGLVARTNTSSVMSYLSVFALTIGTLVIFGLALTSTRGTHTVTEQVPDYDALLNGDTDGNGFTLHTGDLPTKTETRTTDDVRPEKVWWLLAPNPFVILADAAPQKHKLSINVDSSTGDSDFTFDPLGGIAGAVRDARDPNHSVDPLGDRQHQSPVWPYGLAFDALLGLGAITITTRRLRTPVKRLPRGVRLA